MITSKEWEICQVLDAAKSTLWAFLILILNPRAKRSHGHNRIQHPNVKKSSRPRPLQDTVNDLLSNIQKPLEIHHIRTILCPLHVNYLKDLWDFGLNKGGVDPLSPKYRLSSIISSSDNKSVSHWIMFYYFFHVWKVNIFFFLIMFLIYSCSHV